MVQELVPIGRENSRRMIVPDVESSSETQSYKQYSEDEVTRWRWQGKRSDKTSY